MKQETERRRRQRGGRQEREGNRKGGEVEGKKRQLYKEAEREKGVNRTWTRGISKTRTRQSCLPLRALALSHRKVNIPVPPSNGLRPPNSGLS